MLKTTTAVALALCATAATAQPRFFTQITIGGGSCDELIPPPIVNDSTSPSQANVAETCTQFWGTMSITAGANALPGLVGVDAESTWNGCFQFGCGPSGTAVSAGATHEFDVIFSSPVPGTVDITLNLLASGNIQEITSPFRAVNIRVSGPGGSATGRFGQISDGTTDTDIREGLLSNFNENQTNTIFQSYNNVPVNTPIRFALDINCENLVSHPDGGAINFGNGLRLAGTPFTIRRAPDGATTDDIGVNSDDANISDNSYGAPGPSCPADINNDGTADPADFTAWLACFNNPMNLPACEPADVNNDGVIDPADFTAWLAAFQAGCP